MTGAGVANPILNGPYDPPSLHYGIGPHGRTDEVKEGRRPSESLIPIAASRKFKVGTDCLIQTALDSDATGERRERNTFVNDLRKEVVRWRQGKYERVTPTSRKLLKYWADDDRGGERGLFSQREGGGAVRDSEARHER